MPKPNAPKPDKILIERHYHPNRECQLQALMILLSSSPVQTPLPTQVPGDPGENVETALPLPPPVEEES